jgi:hypothetical protein
MSWFRQPPYWAIYCGIVLGIFGLTFFIRPSASPPNPVRLEGGTKIALDLIQEMSKVLTALNVAIVGAAGTLVVKGKDWSTGWTRWDGLAIVLLFVSIAVSYYGLYLTQFALVDMTLSGAISIGENQFGWGRRLQYWGTLVAVTLLGLVFVRMLESRRSP